MGFNSTNCCEKNIRMRWVEVRVMEIIENRFGDGNGKSVITFIRNGTGDKFFILIFVFFKKDYLIGISSREGRKVWINFSKQ